MKSNELRIGNLLQYKNTNDVATVELIHKNHFDCRDELGIFTPNENYEPIPLTEEWLLKFGFEYASDPDYYNITFQILDFYFQSNLQLDGFVCIEINEKLVIKYIHQLQNLYFTLTGEELTLNNK